MAHWTERHTKKDIAASYEQELAALRTENEEYRRRLQWVVDAPKEHASDFLKDAVREFIKRTDREALK